MTQLYIPSLNDDLRLLEDWQFDLYPEHRNSSLIEHFGLQKVADAHREEHGWKADRTPIKVRPIVPAGALLRVARIYIRNGQRDFDSITFGWKGEKTQKRTREYTWMGERHIYVEPSRQVRFWVKLHDANQIKFERTGA